MLNSESESPKPAVPVRIDGRRIPPRVVHDWPINASGETYGSALDAASPGDEPDLIRALTTDGKIGYIRRTEVDAVNGSHVKNPAEALEWMKTVEARAASGERTLVSVYEQDGVTVIGSFEIGPGRSGVRRDGEPRP